MAKRQLTPEFREFLACLNRAGVDYLLVGGYAVNHYGYHRFTEDIDFWIAISDKNFDRLLAAIRQFFGEDLPGLDKKFLQEHEAWFLGAVPNKIEVFTHCSGIKVSSRRGYASENSMPPPRSWRSTPGRACTTPANLPATRSLLPRKRHPRSWQAEFFPGRSSLWTRQRSGRSRAI
jgi:hypothetical protein